MTVYSGDEFYADDVTSGPDDSDGTACTVCGSDEPTDDEFADGTGYVCHCGSNVFYAEA